MPTVLEAFKAKLEAMSDNEFVVENIFPQIKSVQKETGQRKSLYANSDCRFGEMHGPELPETIYLLVVKNQSNTLKALEKSQNSISKELKY